MRLFALALLSAAITMQASAIRSKTKTDSNADTKTDQTMCTSGCELPADAGAVERHCELMNAAVGPDHVKVATPEGVITAHADDVDVQKVSLKCDKNGDCVLVPDPVSGHIDSCRTDGQCYNCIESAEAIKSLLFSSDPTPIATSATTHDEKLA